MAAHYERLQDRGDHDDPPLPAELVRGTAGSLLAPVAIEPARIVESAVESGRQELERLVAQVEESVRAEVGELADSVSPDRIPRLEWMRDWRPER